MALIHIHGIIWETGTLDGICLTARARQTCPIRYNVDTAVTLLRCQRRRVRHHPDQLLRGCCAATAVNACITCRGLRFPTWPLLVTESYVPSPRPRLVAQIKIRKIAIPAHRTLKRARLLRVPVQWHSSARPAGKRSGQSRADRSGSCRRVRQGVASPAAINMGRLFCQGKVG